MLHKELENIGLSEKESKLYLAALELGESNIGQLAKKSGVKRTTVYDIIDSLKSKGLMSFLTKKKKKVYYAVEPQKIEDHLDEQKMALKKVLPRLLSIANFMDKKPKISFFEGDEGIKTVYGDTLKYPGRELLAWASQEAITTFNQKYLDEYYVPKRVENKIWVRAIAPKNLITEEYKGLDEKSLRKTKLVDEEKFPFSVEIDLYGVNKVGILSFEEKFGLIIESQKIHDTLKSIFELNWAMLG